MLPAAFRDNSGMLGLGERHRGARVRLLFRPLDGGAHMQRPAAMRAGVGTVADGLLVFVHAQRQNKLPRT